jgi:hypothetical protein
VRSGPTERRPLDVGARPRHAMAGYLTIAIPSLVLFGLGLRSVRQKYEALDALADKYARLSVLPVYTRIIWPRSFPRTIGR